MYRVELHCTFVVCVASMRACLLRAYFLFLLAYLLVVVALSSALLIWAESATTLCSTFVALPQPTLSSQLLHHIKC